jgi:hypothetical protein
MNIQAIVDALKNIPGAKVSFVEISFPETEALAAADERPSTPSEYKCESCGKVFEPFEWNGKNYSAQQGYNFSKKKNGRPLCYGCAKKQEKAGA